MSEAAQPEREERWDWKPGSGFKVCPVNSYNTLLPEPQAPSQHLPGPWVPFPRLSSLARKGTGGLISYHWASRHLQGSSCPSSAQPQHQAGGEKEWGGKKGETPAIGCPGMTSPGVRVGKQTSPPPSYIHLPGGGEPQGSCAPLPGVRLPPSAPGLGICTATPPWRLSTPPA